MFGVCGLEFGVVSCVNPASVLKHAERQTTNAKPQTVLRPVEFHVELNIRMQSSFNRAGTGSSFEEVLLFFVEV